MLPKAEVTTSVLQDILIAMLTALRETQTDNALAMWTDLTYTAWALRSTLAATLGTHQGPLAGIVMPLQDIPTATVGLLPETQEANPLALQDFPATIAGCPSGWDTPVDAMTL